METALIVLVSVTITMMLYLDRQRRQQIEAAEQRLENAIRATEERLEKASKERHDQLENAIRATEERLEKASKERHDQMMKRFDEWPVREFEHRITKLEQQAAT